MNEFDEWQIKAIEREYELLKQKCSRKLTPLECLEIIEICLTGKDWNNDKPYNRYEYEIETIRKALKESEKQEIKKCKWCGSEIKENHRGYCSELCRDYGEEWEYNKQLAIESEKNDA